MRIEYGEALQATRTIAPYILETLANLATLYSDTRRTGESVTFYGKAPDRKIQTRFSS